MKFKERYLIQEDNLEGINKLTQYYAQKQKLINQSSPFMNKHDREFVNNTQQDLDKHIENKFHNAYNPGQSSSLPVAAHDKIDHVINQNSNPSILDSMGKDDGLLNGITKEASNLPRVDTSALEQLVL